MTMMKMFTFIAHDSINVNAQGVDEGGEGGREGNRKS